MMMYGTVAKHWSKTQASRAFSVAESGFCAIVTGPTETLGMHLLLSDPALKAKVRA